MANGNDGGMPSIAEIAQWFFGDPLSLLINLGQNQQYAQQVEETRRLAQQNQAAALSELGGAHQAAMYGNAPGAPGTTPLTRTQGQVGRTVGAAQPFPEYEGGVNAALRFGGISDAYWGGDAPMTRWNQAIQPLYGAMEERMARGLADREDAIRRAERRYEQAGLESEGITAGARDLYGRGMSYLSDIGTQQRADLQQRYQNLESAAQQDLVSRGLSGTTIGATLGAGMQQAYQADLNRLNEQLANQRLGWDWDLTQNVLGAQTGARDFGAQMSGDVINTLTGQQLFEAGMSGEHLGMGERLATGGIDYGDHAMNQFIGQGLPLAMIPGQMDINRARDLADIRSQTQWQQPYPPQQMQYSWR